MEHIDDRQRMPHADLEIDLVMRGRDFQDTGPKLRIDGRVSHDPKFFAREWTPDLFADQIAIARIVRMNSNACVGHDRFWPRRSHFEEASRLVDDLVTYVVELPLLRLRDDFFVGE